MGGLRVQLDQQAADFSLAITEVNRSLSALGIELREAVRQTHQRLDQQWQNEREHAEHWLHQTEATLGSIATLRHDKFQPGTLAALQARYQLARDNLRHGLGQAATAAAQERFFEAQELLIEVQVREQQWNVLYAAAGQALADLLALCDQERHTQLALDTHEGPQQQALEVDWWTQAGLSALEQQLKADQQRLGQDPSLDTLQQQVAATEGYRQRLHSLSDQAKAQALAALARQEMARTVANTLARSGFELTEIASEGSPQEDARAPLHLKLKNLSQDEVVVIISPQESPQGIAAQVSLKNYDYNSNDPLVVAKRLRALQQSLQNNGIDCGNYACAPGTENAHLADERYKNFEAVRQATPQPAQQPGRQPQRQGA
jgi:hypothetical protein